MPNLILTLKKIVLSTNEVYADDVRSEKRPGRRVAIISLAILLAVCALGAAGYFIARQRAARINQGGAQGAAPVANESKPAAAVAANSWKITGALTEACTCSVPCSCNFGEGPSPHSYCYPFYSFDIRKGNYGDVSLDGLRFGSADLKSGRHIFIDERADARQREALQRIAARVIEHASAEDTEKVAKEIAGKARYAAIEQSYDDRRNHLKVAGIGEFDAFYVMGMDKNAPLVVRNNTTWRVKETIKAKTNSYKIKLGRDVIDTKDTNSNQAEFEYTEATDFGGPVQWNCGAEANHAAGGGEQSCGH
jgi:hypothetical protein